MVGGPLVDFIWRRDLLQLALAQHRNEIGHGERFGLVVRDVEGRGTEPVAEALDLAAHGQAQAGVEIRQRLVHQKRRGIAHDRPRQRDPLALPARELAWTSLEEAVDLERGGDLGHHARLLRRSDFAIRKG